MRPALGERFVRPLTIGHVALEDLIYVREEIQAFRPRNRCNKDIAGKKVILSHDCVYLSPDLNVNTSGDTFR